MVSCRTATAEALEEHFDASMFHLLKYFHIAGAAVSLVSHKGVSPTVSETTANAYYQDQLDRLPHLRPSRGNASKTSTSRGEESYFKFSKAFGFNDIERDELVNIENTLFDSGTCARALCGLALSKLEREGKINMQSDMSKYLNDYLGDPMTLEEVFMKKGRLDSPSQDKENLDLNVEEGLGSTWDEHASWCAEQIIEKASGMDFRTYMDKELPKLGVNLQKIDESSGKECFTYLYKNSKMLQLKTLQSKLTPDSGLIATTTQMNKILTAILSQVQEKERSGKSGYELLPGFGFGFKSVSFVPGGLSFFVCVSAMQDNGNAIICVEPKGKWAMHIACNTCSEDKGKFKDLFKGEPLCYFILKDFIQKFGVSDEVSQQSLTKWTIDPGPERGDHIISLFCFPYVGGNGRQIFKSWYSLLPEFIEVKSVSLPGRGPRINEKPRTKLLMLAEEIALGILPSLKDKKFCFYGDGIGALLAFEVGRYLKVNHGLTPIWCFFSSCPSPTTYTAKYGEDYPLLEKGNKLNAAMVDRLCASGKLPTCLKENPLLARAMLPSIQSDMTMESSYKYMKQPYKHVKCDEYFCESDVKTLSALTPTSSPRREKSGQVLKLACPITVFRGSISDAEEKGIEQWKTVTEAEEARFVQVPGSLRIDKDLKTMEDICAIIAESVGTSLTKSRFESWISWAARCM